MVIFEWGKVQPVKLVGLFTHMGDDQWSIHGGYTWSCLESKLPSYLGQTKSRLPDTLNLQVLDLICGDFLLCFNSWFFAFSSHLFLFISFFQLCIFSGVAFFSYISSLSDPDLSFLMAPLSYFLGCSIQFHDAVFKEVLFLLFFYCNIWLVSIMISVRVHYSPGCWFLFLTLAFILSSFEGFFSSYLLPHHPFFWIIFVLVPIAYFDFNHQILELIYISVPWFLLFCSEYAQYLSSIVVFQLYFSIFVNVFVCVLRCFCWFRFFFFWNLFAFSLVLLCFSVIVAFSSFI